MYVKRPLLEANECSWQDGSVEVEKTRHFTDYQGLYDGSTYNSVFSGRIYKDRFGSSDLVGSHGHVLGHGRRR